MIRYVRKMLGKNPGIALSLWWHIGLLLLGFTALPFDHRQILGLNPWIKPLKFDLSVLIYLATAAVLLSLLAAVPERTRSRIGWTIGLSLLSEDSIISLQSARGVRSHMNYTSAFNGIAFALMGAFILINTAAVARLFLLWIRSRPALPSTLIWGVRLGLATFLAGSLEGFAVVAQAAHTVGAREGGAGLPFVNWSTTHGDLRVPHFFALHTLQLFPLLGWAISRLRWPASVQVSTLFVLVAAYLGAIWELFHQAMSGRPFLT